MTSYFTPFKICGDFLPISVTPKRCSWSVTSFSTVGLAREGLSQSLRSNGEPVLGSPVYITSYPKSYRENERKWAKALTKYMTDPLGFTWIHSILFRPIPSRCCDSGIPGRGQF